MRRAADCSQAKTRMCSRASPLAARRTAVQEPAVAGRRQDHRRSGRDREARPTLRFSRSANPPTGWKAKPRAAFISASPGNQEKLLEAVVATGKPVILVVLAGQAARAEVGCRTCAGNSRGVESGHRSRPCRCRCAVRRRESVGQAAVELSRAPWARSRSTTRKLPTGRPAHGDLSRMPRNAAEKFVSRYMDEQNSALFPFGWGLSYTRFSYAQADCQPRRSSGARSRRRSQAGGDGRRGCQQHRQRGGNRSGAALHSQYRGQRGAAGARAERLCARITLAPGETKHVTFPWDSTS